MDQSVRNIPQVILAESLFMLTNLPVPESVERLGKGQQLPDLCFAHEEPQPRHDVQHIPRSSKLLENVFACKELHEVSVVSDAVVVAVTQLVHDAAGRHRQRFVGLHHAGVHPRSSQELLDHRVHFGVHDVFQGYFSGVTVSVQDVPHDLSLSLPAVAELPESQVAAFVDQWGAGEGGPSRKVVPFRQQRVLDHVKAADNNSWPAAHGDADDVTVLLAHARKGDRRSFAKEGEITDEREPPGSWRRL